MWDAFTEFFKPFLGSTSKDMIIVIIQFGKLGTWNNHPNVSNGYDGTKIFINDDSIADIYDFKKRLVTDDCSVYCREII